jgi:hypothetical protein
MFSRAIRPGSMFANCAGFSPIWAPRGVSVPNGSFRRSLRCGRRRTRAGAARSDTAQYGLVWPNEWPNGVIHARDDERGAREGRDRRRVVRSGRCIVTFWARGGERSHDPDTPATRARATSASRRSAVLHSRVEWDVERRAGDCCRRRSSGLDRALTCAQRTCRSSEAPW